MLHPAPLSQQAHRLGIGRNDSCQPAHLGRDVCARSSLIMAGEMLATWLPPSCAASSSVRVRCHRQPRRATKSRCAGFMACIWAIHHSAAPCAQTPPDARRHDSHTAFLYEHILDPGRRGWPCTARPLGGEILVTRERFVCREIVDSPPPPPACWARSIARSDLNPCKRLLIRLNLPDPAIP